MTNGEKEGQIERNHTLLARLVDIVAICKAEDNDLEESALDIPEKDTCLYGVGAPCLLDHPWFLHALCLVLRRILVRILFCQLCPWKEEVVE